MRELFHLRLGSLSLLAIVAAIGFFLLRFALGALERSGKMRPATDSERSARTDVAYLILSPITEVFSRTLTTFGVVGCALAFGRHVGPELLQGFGPVMRQPRWAILAEMFVLSDVLYYWTHRAAHTIPALWRFHAVHHSTAHLRWSSAFRAHPGEVYVYFLNVLPLFALGFPLDALEILAPITTLYAVIIHSNVDFAVRPLSFVLNSPRYHAVHHQLDMTDGTKNYSAFFPLWDALFGTYSLPDRRPEAFGMDDPEMPKTCLAQIEYVLWPGDAETSSVMPDPVPEREHPSLISATGS